MVSFNDLDKKSENFDDKFVQGWVDLFFLLDFLHILSRVSFLILQFRFSAFDDKLRTVRNRVEKINHIDRLLITTCLYYLKDVFELFHLQANNKALNDLQHLLMSAQTLLDDLCDSFLAESAVFV